MFVYNIMGRRKISRRKISRRKISRRKKVSRGKVSRGKVSRGKVVSRRRKYTNKYRRNFTRRDKNKIIRIIKKINNMKRKYRGIQKGGSPTDTIGKMTDILQALVDSMKYIGMVFYSLDKLLGYVNLSFILFEGLHGLIN